MAKPESSDAASVMPAASGAQAASRQGDSQKYVKGYDHWLIERARPSVAATAGEQPSGITAGADTVGAAAR